MPTSTSIPTAALSGLLLSAVLGLTPALAAQGYEHHKLLPDDGLTGDSFGFAVATDGTLVAVGAPRADDLGSSSGSAYLFAAGSGAQLLELLPLGGDPGEQFGFSIAVDGAHVVVGAPFANGSGAAYVFDTATGAQLFELEPADAAAGDQFGHAVAIDGGLVVVGTLGQGAYLFDAATGQELEQLLPDAGLPFGGGGIVIVNGGFGQAVDIDADTGRIVVGAEVANGVYLGGPYQFSGTAYVFDTSGDELLQLSAIFPSAWSYFGASVGIDGGTIAIGSPFADPNGKESGAAYLFDAFTGQEITKLVPSDGHVFQKYGSSVGVDGPYAVIGAEQDNNVALFSSGSAYLYDAQDGSLVVKLNASDAAALDELGGAVAVGSGVLVAGAARDDDNGDASGSAYVFDETGFTTTMVECLGNVGSLDHVGGIPVAGQNLLFRMDVAQPATTLALLAASEAPAPGWPSCGLNVGGAGELLLDLDTLLLTSTTPWTGSPADLSVDVPPVRGLVGYRFYVQGVFLAPLTAQPVRLTGGLEVEIGGYL